MHKYSRKRRAWRENVKRLKWKSLIKRRDALVFFLGFAMGIILINILGRGYLSEAGILSEYFLSQYKYMEINALDLFFYIMEKRIKWEVIVWVLGYTAIGVPCAVAFILWFGFAAGVLLSISVLKMGGAGILFCLAATLPQMLIYIPVWFMLIYNVYKKRERKGSANWSYALVGVGALLFTGVGVLVESYINPLLLRQILRIF